MLSPGLPLIVLTAASLTFGGLAWLGHERLGRDELPGEVWHGPRDTAPAALSSTYHYQSVAEEEAQSAVAQLRANRAALYPCTSLVEVAFIIPGSAAAEDRPGEKFGLLAASSDRWAVEHARDEKSFVGSDGQRLMLQMGWDPVGIDLTGVAGNDGGPLSLPSWMLRPEYLVGVDPRAGVVQLQATGQADPLLQATFHVELSTALVREAHLVLAPPSGGQPIQLQQKVLKYERLASDSPLLTPLADGKDGDFESVNPKEADVLAPPGVQQW